VESAGHSLSWGAGYPNLLTPCYDNDKPISILNVASNTTFDAVRSVFKAASPFSDKSLHLGGDEVVLGCWGVRPASLPLPLPCLCLGPCSPPGDPWLLGWDHGTYRWAARGESGCVALSLPQEARPCSPFWGTQWVPSTGVRSGSTTRRVRLGFPERASV
jgi:Glycosyl hydrolase family 20, catalytic domain